MTSLRFFTVLEKILIVFLFLIMIGTSVYLYQRFIRDNSELISAEGGIYTEGLVGRPQLLNPLFLTGNTVDRDISQLIFSGLTRFNPHNGLIEDDIATSEKSKDNFTYTFTIVPNARWHDAVAVTADDILFTYQTVLQNKNFPNSPLKQAFQDVTLKKIDERRVEFRLSEPYSFFLANVTLGLLPRHLLEVVPVENLTKSEFHQRPIGTGPYLFVNWTPGEESHEITLQRFDDYYGALPKIQTVIFRVFPDPTALLVAENTLSGFRLGPDQDVLKNLERDARFTLFSYRLPQYTALFLNTDSPFLSNKKVRFALLLATNKEEVAAKAGSGDIVDTPILESKADLDIEFRLERARGAFFDTEWNLPEKVKQKDLNPGIIAETDRATNAKNRTNARSEALKVLDQLKFTIKAEQDTWISLALDGQSQKAFLLNQGKSKEYTVEQSLTFETIGNAAGVAMTINDIPLKSLGNPGQVIRNLTFDRQSLLSYVVLESIPVAKEEPKTIEEPEKTEEEILEDGDVGKIRINAKGERLILRLITAQDPPAYLRAAELIQKQWLEAGAKVVVETYNLSDLQEKIQKRDYDILLFGQNLGYNLDAFPFWHSSQAGNGLNLSNYRSLEADNLLVAIRRTFDERTKLELLERLKKIIAQDTPAVFLYNPNQYYAIDTSVKNIQLDHLSNHADRFTDLLQWYMKQQYALKEPFGLSLLLQWMFTF